MEESTEREPSDPASGLVFDSRESRYPRALRPFFVRQYRMLATALILSLFGTGIWMVALVWQVIELGGGPRELSIVASIASFGLLSFVLLGGAMADRIPQRRILIAVILTKLLAVAVVAFLALSGVLHLWHLVAAGVVLAISDAFFYPAYSALLPAILPTHQLLAANGLEGMLRPVIMQAAGPAAAGGIIALYSPGIAIAAFALSLAFSLLVLLFLPQIPLRRDLEKSEHPVRDTLADIRSGFVYMRRTPWVLSTLLFACILVLLIMGPIEVLLPFLIRDKLGGGAWEFALVLAMFGAGGAIGSMLMASWKLPRRYLSVMIVLWGFGCLPLALVGYATALWMVATAIFLVGFTFSAATVIWGTLLQQRVPPEMLGRVSSLDFFVSLTLMPVSMAIAGPVAEIIGLSTVFVIAGVIPAVLSVIAILAPKLHHDEVEHPLISGDPRMEEVQQDSGSDEA